MLRFALSATIVYVVLYPVWRFCTPHYDQLISTTFGSMAFVFEHPRMTEGIRVVGFQDNDIQKQVISRAVRGGGFTISTGHPYINIPILLALALSSPAISWRARSRIVVWGFMFLAGTHLLQVASSVWTGYARAPLVSEGLRPGYASAVIVFGLSNLFRSDLALILPFGLWSALYLWERRALPGNRAEIARQRPD